MAAALVRGTCRGLQLRFDLAFDWLDARLLTDRSRSADVVSVEAVMAAVTAQLDAKIHLLATAFTARFPPPPNPEEAAAEDGAVLTGANDKHNKHTPLLTLPSLHVLIKEVHADVTEAQALEVYVSLTRAAPARAPTGHDFAHGRLSFSSVVYRSVVYRLCRMQGFVVRIQSRYVMSHV